MPEATPTPGETGAAVAPKTDPTPPVTPTTPSNEPVKTEDLAVEQLRKQLEQTQMRANQLENEKKQREQQEADRKAKELEEQSQFKELAEQEKAKREALEAEIAEREQKAEIEKARNEVLKDYSDEVKALAEEVGLDLTAADENAVTSFKEKLDKINSRVTGTDKIKGNNPNPVNNEPELSGDELREALQDENKFHEIVTKKFPGIAAMTNQQKS